jgi:hypothetical protein
MVVKVFSNAFLNTLPFFTSTFSNNNKKSLLNSFLVANMRSHTSRGLISLVLGCESSIVGTDPRMGFVTVVKPELAKLINHSSPDSLVGCPAEFLYVFPNGFS